MSERTGSTYVNHKGQRLTPCGDGLHQGPSGKLYRIAPRPDGQGFAGIELSQAEVDDLTIEADTRRWAEARTITPNEGN